MKARKLLRDALESLRQEAGEDWTTELAAEVVRQGGGDAVDLMHLALDDALDTVDQNGSETN